MEDDFGWEDGYSVNVAVLDEQHKVLFKTMAQLDIAIKAGIADAVIDGVLKGLIQHTLTHFAAEEALLEEYDFPDLAAHRTEHQKLVQKLTKFNLSHMAGMTDVPPALLEFLKELWRSHILKTDREYSAFLKARGVC